MLPSGGPVILSIILVGWYVGGLGLPAPTLPAGLRPPLRITGGTATLLQTAQGGHIVVRTDTQVNARSNRKAGDGEGRAGDHCV